MYRNFVERFCNGVPLPKPFTDFLAPIPEGFNPMLHPSNSSKLWPPRQDNFRIPKVKIAFGKKTLTADPELMQKNLERLEEAIEKKEFLYKNGTIGRLEGDGAVDILGHMIQATLRNPNEKLYGSLHNELHLSIAFAHDPHNTSGVRLLLSA